MRTACPPSSCICGRRITPEELFADPRVLRLTLHEEQRLLAHIDGIRTLDEVLRLSTRLSEQLGIELSIKRPASTVRRARDLRIEITEQTGLCRKTRKSIPSALYQVLEQQPELLYRLLDDQDLLTYTKLPQ